MAIFAHIAMVAGVALLAFLSVSMIFFAGVIWEKISSAPKRGFIRFSSHLNKEEYNDLIDRGCYQGEQDMLQDALNLVNWAIDNSREGRCIASLEPDGTDIMEYVTDTFTIIRAAFNPIPHLERCLDLDLDEK